MVGRVLCMTALLVGCRATGVFVCTSDTQCRHGATPGRCEPVGFCSFPDTHCASGSRFDDNSGPGYENKCVGIFDVDAGIDAPQSFDISMCPPDYTSSIPSTMATSRYRLIVAQLPAWPHVMDCDDDKPGATHLVLPQTEQELLDLAQWLSAISMAPGHYYAGVVQNPAATTPTEGWLLFDDSPVPFGTAWRSGDPNDSDNNEIDHAEQLAFFSRFSGNLSDTPGSEPHGAVCECDGKTWGPIARAYFDSDPNNPNP